MTREQAIQWAGSEAAGEKVLAIIDRWEELGYEPQVRLTRTGNLAIEVSMPLSKAEDEECDTERPPEREQQPLLPPP